MQKCNYIDLAEHWGSAVYSVLFALNMSYLCTCRGGVKHYFKSYDIMYICLAKIVSCPSKYRFDQTT